MAHSCGSSMTGSAREACEAAGTGGAESVTAAHIGLGTEPPAHRCSAAHVRPRSWPMRRRLASTLVRNRRQPGVRPLPSGKRCPPAKIAARPVLPWLWRLDGVWTSIRTAEPLAATPATSPLHTQEPASYVRSQASTPFFATIPLWRGKHRQGVRFPPRGPPRSASEPGGASDPRSALARPAGQHAPRTPGAVCWNATWRRCPSGDQGAGPDHDRRSLCGVHIRN